MKTVALVEGHPVIHEGGVGRGAVRSWRPVQGSVELLIVERIHAGGRPSSRILFRTGDTVGFPGKLSLDVIVNVLVRNIHLHVGALRTDVRHDIHGVFRV